MIISSVFISCPLGGSGETTNPPGEGNNNTIVTVPSFFWGSWVSGDDEWKITDVLVDRPYLADSAFLRADDEGFELWNVKVSKVSQNVIYADGHEDFYLFRLSGADAEMKFSVKTLDSSSSVSRGISDQISGLGNISVILQNLDIGSDKHELTTNQDGFVTAEGTISGDTYEVTLEGNGISEPITTELSAFFDGQDLGTVMVNNPDKNMKLSYIIRGVSSWDKYIYALPDGAGEDYEIKLFFNNIGSEVISDLTYEVTPPPGLSLTGELTGTYPSITSGYSLILGIEADPIEDFRQSFIIPVTMSDSEGNIWEDGINLMFYRESAEISVKSRLGRNCSGVIITPEGQALPVSHPYNSFEITVPARTEPYQLVISETEYYSGESWYSLGIDNDSTEIYDLSPEESDPNEPNDSEYSTTPLFSGEIILGKIEPGDVDIFSAYVTPVNFHVLFEPEGGTYFKNLVVTLTNQAGGTLRWSDSGRAPEESDSTYSGPIALDESGIIKASAFGGELPEGIVFSENYELKVPAPLVTPETGESLFLVEENPSAPSGSLLRYTLNGSEPDESSSLCTTGNTITIAAGEILKVRAFKEGWSSSFTAASAYSPGERGPSGGYIFEDKGEYSDGWRFKEVRSQTLSEQYDWAMAAIICTELDDSGFSDWLLPSRFELSTFWEEIVDTDIANYSGYCWSSTEVDRSSDAYQFTLHAGISSNHDVDDKLLVLPIRYF